MQWMSDPQIWMAFATLATLEIVLGIDNIIFITILTAKLPAQNQAKGRTVGLALAMLTRIALLFSITLLMKLTTPWFALFGHDISGRDLILMGGGLFLLGKSTFEIHDNLEGSQKVSSKASGDSKAGFTKIIIQIIILDIIFSLDSVITAVGLADQLAVMVAAIVAAVGVMMFLAGSIAHFVEAHPTLKILALSFLLIVGFSLLGEGFGLHIPKGYIYFAMAFSIFVECLNIRMRKGAYSPVKLHHRKGATKDAASSA
jgi:predicted tellurium resistance membrane protein TerC